MESMSNYGRCIQKEKRATLKAHLNTYQTRKKKYQLNPEKYKNEIANCNKKIRSFQRSLRVIEKRQKTIINIAQKIEDFTGIDLIKAKYSKSKAANLSRNLFFKYGIEHGISGNFLAEYCKIVNKGMPSIMRRKFTKTFETNVENKTSYYRFKQTVL